MIKMRMFFWQGLVVFVLGFGACQINEVNCDSECEAGWLDGSEINDSCANGSNTNCLVSKRFLSPTAEQLQRPVIIAVHGFGASTYEWQELKDSIDTKINVVDPKKDSALVSLVLLGGHGRDIDSFRSTKWEDWGRPILTEYDSLVARGYKNISFAGASTGAALILQAIAEGRFSKKPAPNWFFFIDPIIIPSAKLLSLANIVGPILGNSPNPGNEEENKHWYVNRPEENLRELYELTNRVKNHLEDGFVLPKGSHAKVYKSIHDRSADPIGALYIYKGIRTSGGDHVLVEMINSRRHVFTRLHGRGGLTLADSTLQSRVFSEMAKFANAAPGTGTPIVPEP